MTHDIITAAQSSISYLHPSIIGTYILNKLDSKSLSSASCVSKEFNILCNSENLWKNVCTTLWPSSLDHLVQTNIKNFRLFFSDASPAVNHHHHHLSHPQQNPRIKNLISAVDIFYEDKVIFSRAMLTESSSSWFSCSLFKIDLLEQKEIFPTEVKITGDDQERMDALEKSLKLSWILINGDSKRASTFSSVRPVSVRRYWMTGEIKIRYALVVPDCRHGQDGEVVVQCGVVLRCENNEEMKVNDVNLFVEDKEGLILDGNEGLEIVQEVIKVGRWMKNKDEERERYEKFLKCKLGLSEMEQREENRLDMNMIVVLTGVSIFLILCMTLLF